MSNSNGWKIYQRLLTSVKPYSVFFIGAVIGNILFAVVDGGFVKFLEPLLNEGFVARNHNFIRWVPFVIVAIFFLRSCASFMATYFMGYVGRRVVMDFRQKMFNHLLCLPAQFFDEHKGGNLVSRLTYNVEQLADASTDALTILLRESATLCAYLGVMFSVNWRLTLLFLTIVPIVAALMHIVSKRARRLSHRIQQSMGQITHIGSEFVESFRVVKLFGGEAYEKKRFYTAANDNRQQEMKLITTTALSVPMVQLIAAVALAFTIYLATLSPENTFGTALTPGGFTAMISAMILLLKPVKQLTKVNTKIQRGLAGAQSVFELLDQMQEVDNGTKVLESLKGTIAIKDLKFTYPNTRREILKSINLNINAGETVALVGRSGSGKTTLVNLLARFYQYEGNISLDGIDIQSLTLTNLRQNISYVSQHINLFNDSIFHNIAYGSGDSVKESEVIKAAKLAHAWEFIQELPEGLATLVGEKGLKLSGGQRQRLSIARALLKHAPILILDEATSALDPEAEQYIQSALKNLMGNCTTIIIAHRLSTVEHADRIIVLDHGKIIEQGTHLELLAENGHYQHLVRSQQLKAI